ncbi:MAG: hypothetical protein AAB267_06905, partial [Candidatus Desantisbacteria bacterium]
VMQNEVLFAEFVDKEAQDIHIWIKGLFDKEVNGRKRTIVEAIREEAKARGFEPEDRIVDGGFAVVSVNEAERLRWETKYNMAKSIPHILRNAVSYAHSIIELLLQGRKDIDNISFAVDCLKTAKDFTANVFIDFRIGNPVFDIRGTFDVYESLKICDLAERNDKDSNIVRTAFISVVTSILSGVKPEEMRRFYILLGHIEHFLNSNPLVMSSEELSAKLTEVEVYLQEASILINSISKLAEAYEKNSEAILALNNNRVDKQGVEGPILTGDIAVVTQRIARLLAGNESNNCLERARFVRQGLLDNYGVKETEVRIVFLLPAEMQAATIINRDRIKQQGTPFPIEGHAKVEVKTGNRWASVEVNSDRVVALEPIGSIRVYEDYIYIAEAYNEEGIEKIVKESEFNYNITFKNRFFRDVKPTTHPACEVGGGSIDTQNGAPADVGCEEEADSSSEAFDKKSITEENDFTATNSAVVEV